MPYPRSLETGYKTYWIEDGRIFSHHKDGFGDVISQVHLELDDNWALEKIWAQMHDIFAFGKQTKLKEIKNALEI